MKTYLTLILAAVSISLFVTSCGPAVSEDDAKKADESAKELETIDYDNVEMPGADEAVEEAGAEEEFDADAVLD